MIKRISQFLALLLFASVVNAQTAEDSVKSKRMDAEYHLYNGNIEQAMKIYKELLADDPLNCNLNYKLGSCYQRMPFGSGRSIQYFKKAVADVTPDYIEGSVSENRAPILAWYSLAKAYHANKLFDEGVVAYQQYIDRLSPNDLQARKLAMREMISCRTAAEIVMKPIPAEIFNIGNVINTEFDDFNPCPTVDGRQIVFSRMEKWQTVYRDGRIGDLETKLRVYTTNYLGNERWSAPIDITDELRTNDKCSVVDLSEDGTYMLLVAHDSLADFSHLRYGGTLYYATRADKNAKWSPIKKFDKSINLSNAHISAATISNDRKTLLIVSDKDGGYGGFDIWKCEMKNESKGEWGKYENLGKFINTEYDESFPKMLPNGRTLFFTSMGHYNMGGFDIFKSTMNENGEWTEPVNVGAPINTSSDNEFYKPANNGNTGFYSVAYNEGYFTFGGVDVFQVEIATDVDKLVPAHIKGKVTFEDEKNNSRKARIQIRRDVIGGDVLKELRIDEDGTFDCYLTEGVYTFDFVCSGYLQVQRRIEVERATERKEIELNMQFQTDDIILILDAE